MIENCITFMPAGIYLILKSCTRYIVYLSKYIILCSRQQFSDRVDFTHDHLFSPTMPRSARRKDNRRAVRNFVA